jgi:hypothetical protein
MRHKYGSHKSAPALEPQRTTKVPQVNGLMKHSAEPLIAWDLGALRACPLHATATQSHQPSSTLAGRLACRNWPTLNQIYWLACCIWPACVLRQASLRGASASLRGASASYRVRMLKLASACGLVDLSFNWSACTAVGQVTL